MNKQQALKIAQEWTHVGRFALLDDAITARDDAKRKEGKN